MSIEHPLLIGESSPFTKTKETLLAIIDTSSPNPPLSDENHSGTRKINQNCQTFPAAAFEPSYLSPLHKVADQTPKSSSVVCTSNGYQMKAASSTRMRISLPERLPEVLKELLPYASGKRTIKKAEDFERTLI